MRGVAWFDGGSRPNPGPSAAAAILDWGGQRVAAGVYLGTATNNVAEYEGLMLALDLADDRVSEIDICGDSKLIINQLDQRWEVRSKELKPYYSEAYEYLQTFEDYKLEHFKRSHNYEADHLVDFVLRTHQRYGDFKKGIPKDLSHLLPLMKPPS